MKQLRLLRRGDPMARCDTEAHSTRFSTSTFVVFRTDLSLRQERSPGGCRGRATLGKSPATRAMDKHGNIIRGEHVGQSSVCRTANSSRLSDHVERLARNPRGVEEFGLRPAFGDVVFRCRVAVLTHQVSLAHYLVPVCPVVAITRHSRSHMGRHTVAAQLSNEQARGILHSSDRLRYSD